MGIETVNKNYEKVFFINMVFFLRHDHDYQCADYSHIKHIFFSLFLHKYHLLTEIGQPR